MSPAVPVSHHVLAEAADHVLVETDPALFIARRASGGFRLWLRHRGLSWLAYEIGDADARAAAKYILSQLPDAHAIDLVEHQLPDRGAAQH
jgi:hypothetical protein